MNHRRWVVVPKSVDAMSRLDIDQVIFGDLVEFELNQKDFDYLYELGCFDLIYDVIGVYVDDYEDSLIGWQDALKVHEQLNIMLAGVKGGHDMIGGLFLKCFNHAIQYKTAVYFYF